VERLPDLSLSLLCPGDREDELLLCRRFETCGCCAHASCLGLPGVPLDDWTCAACLRAAGRRARVRERDRVVESPVLDSDAAVGQGPVEDSWVSAELNATQPSDFEQLFMERPPSPDDAARERRWVQRQRAITASVDAQRATDDVAGGATGAGAVHRTRTAHRTALRTVGELRTNWDQLRQGVLSFPAFRAAQPAPSRSARTLLSTQRAEQGAEPQGNSAPVAVENAIERSWEALAALTAQQRRRVAHAAQQPRHRAGAAMPAPTRNVGHLEHLVFTRRLREQRAEPSSRRAQRSPSPPKAVWSSAAVLPSYSGFRIPKRKLDDA
jgi:hypothetical protein